MMQYQRNNNLIFSYLHLQNECLCLAHGTIDTANRTDSDKGTHRRAVKINLPGVYSFPCNSIVISPHDRAQESAAT